MYTLTPGMGMWVGGDQFRTPNPRKSQTNHKTSQKQINQKYIKKRCFSYFVPSAGNFDIDAGDGGEDSQIPTKYQHKTNNQIYIS